MTVDDWCEAAERLTESWLNGNWKNVADTIAGMHPLAAGWVCVMISTRLKEFRGNFVEYLSKRVEALP